LTLFHHRKVRRTSRTLHTCLWWDAPQICWA